MSSGLGCAWSPELCPHLSRRPLIKRSWVKSICVCVLRPARLRVAKWPSRFILFPRIFLFFPPRMIIFISGLDLCDSLLPSCLQSGRLPPILMLQSDSFLNCTCEHAPFQHTVYLWLFPSVQIKAKLCLHDMASATPFSWALCSSQEEGLASFHSHPACLHCPPKMAV